MSNLRSWNCKGCTNVCFRYIWGEIHRYCKPMIDGRHKIKWVTDTFVECLDKTTEGKTFEKEKSEVEK